MNVVNTSSLERNPGVIMGTDRTMPSDEVGRVSDQQGWYHGKRLPSLDGAGVLIHWVIYSYEMMDILLDGGGAHVTRLRAN